ncbi:hypothetical protein Pyn_17921 [Prunus yedoensis var. nudiflora]|uniref:Uncharacterized protein n=1 Tax=Prunus yedoensis var. nudiflora TaxID=2094558 RepID=A0A314YG56_PRUYE|nr:hypothetical protein Pyn_17921 [Prunus yedoensis var. nudiflora]
MGLGCYEKKANQKILLKPEFKNQTPKRIFKRLAEALEKYVRVLFTNTQKNAWISLMTQREELVAWELSFHRMASILEQRETLGVEDGKIPVSLTKLGLALEWCVLLGRRSSVL